MRAALDGVLGFSLLALWGWLYLRLSLRLARIRATQTGRKTLDEINFMRFLAAVGDEARRLKEWWATLVVSPILVAMLFLFISALTTPSPSRP